MLGFGCHVVVGFGTYMYFKMCDRIVFYIVMGRLRGLGVIVSIACLPVAVFTDWVVVSAIPTSCWIVTSQGAARFVYGSV